MFSGDRIAVCSSAQRVLIYDRDEASDAQWVLSDVIEHAHDAPIWRVDWAPPEFGQVIATCSEDRFLFIWSERGPDNSLARMAPLGASHSVSRTSRWSRVARLHNPKGALTDVSFAPSTTSLKVGTCSADGTVTIYESTGDLTVWDLEDTLRCHMGQGSQEIATSGQMQPGTGARGCSALSWSKANWLRAMVVVGVDGTLQLWCKVQTWKLTAQVRAHDGCVRDVAWAPNLARETELVATCGDDGKAIIWSIDARTEGVTSLEESTFSKVAVLDCASGSVWRVSWNLTGTTLAVGADDGSVSIWKQNDDGDWMIQANVTVGDEDIHEIQEEHGFDRNNMWGHIGF